MMKHHKQLLGLMIGGTLIGAGGTTLQGCDAAEDLCGPCGTIATGQLSISGDARLDGFFTAVATFKGASGKIKADFDAEILAIADAFGMATAGVTVDADFIKDLKAQINAEFSAAGGVSIKFTPPSCEANVNVAVEAQASCEASADCDVMVDPGEVSVSCEGKCEGSCEGTCEGSFACVVELPKGECTGMCEGSCSVEGGLACEGTCNGGCEGTCSVEDSDGNCRGECTGMCTGSCEFAAAAECSGSCSGSCKVEPGSAQCSAEAECSGSCMGECGGSCEGSFTPPSASAECEASAECNAQASAQAEASLECTPPSIDLAFEFGGEIGGEAHTAFLLKIDALKVHGAGALQAGARITALVNGEVNGEVVFSPSPLANLTTELAGFASLDAVASFDIPAGRLPCVVPAFTEAGKALVDAGGSVTGTISAQAEFVTLFTGG